MSREIELKLEMNEGDAAALRSHPLLSGQAEGSVEQVSTYFDTPRSAVRKAGFSLRVRRVDGRFIQTIKQATAAAGLFSRPEWESDIAGPDPDWGAAGASPLAKIIGKKQRARLAPVSESRVTRTIWPVKLPSGWAEATLDEGEIKGGARSASITELELELKEGDAAGLIEVARTLARDLPLRIGVLTKDERGFALADGSAGKPAKAEPVGLDRGMSAAEGFAAIAHACLRHFRRNEPLVARERDPDALHQARVAMRRLRSAFSLFRPVIADAHYEELREELRWFTGELGEARNLDVLLKRLRANKGGDAKKLRRKLKSARQEAYDAALAALDSHRLRALMIDLVGWVEAGEWRGSAAARAPLTEFAVGQLDKRWKKVAKGGRGMAGLEAEPLHRLRIEVKKLRYAIEFLASLQPEAEQQRKEALKALEAMQEELGELNDRDTAAGLLARLLGDDPDLARKAQAMLADERGAELEIGKAEAAHRELVETGRFWK